MQQKNQTRRLVFAALLIALEIILTRFVQIPIPLDGFTNRISLGFLPVAMGGMLYGPLWGGLLAAIADIIRALLFPQGAINPLFTLTAFMRGTVYGSFLYKKISPLRITLAAACDFLLINLLLNPLFTFLSYGGTFWARVMTALPVSAVNFALRLVLLLCVLPPMERSVRRRV